MINYEYYKIFYIASKYKNFTKAAEALNTSQSAISHTMQKLEQQLECRLFIRSQHGIELTSEGQLLYEYVSKGCELFKKAEDEINNYLSLEKGTIYLSTTETALHCFLFDALNKFHNLYHNIHFKITNHTSIQAVDTIKKGTADFAIVSSPITIHKPLITKVLKTFQDLLIAGVNFQFESNFDFSLSMLKDYPHISLFKGSVTRQFFDDFFHDNGLQIEPDIEVATTDMILPVVKNNLGIGFIPDKLAETEIERGNVRNISIDILPPKRNIQIVSNPSFTHSLAANAFYEFLIFNYI